MKKFILEESEITRILSMHKVINEQATSTKSDVDPLLQKLRESIINGCLSNGIIYWNKTKNTYFYRGVKQSTKQEIDFFPDMTYNFVDGSKKGKWFCNLTQKAVKDASTLAVTTDSTNNLKQMKDRGWMEYSELTEKGFSTLEAKEGKYPTTQFDMGNGNKITLYKPKNIGGKLEQYTTVQKALITGYTKDGVYKLKDDESNQRKIGLIAQEVNEVLPEVVDIPLDDNIMWGIRYSEIVPVLVKAIQELKVENDSLKEILQRNNIN